MARLLPTGPSRALRLILALGLLAGARAVPAGVPVARVDGVVIEQARLDRAVSDHASRQGRNVAAVQRPATWRQLVREALDLLIDEELLAQEAVRRGHQPDPQEVARALASLKAGLQGPAAFEILLERDGVDEAGLAARLGRELAVRRLVGTELGGDGAAVRARLAALRASARIQVLLPLEPAP